MPDLYDPEDAAEFQLVIRHNTVSGEFTVEGWQKNRLVSIGMLEFAKQLIHRENIKQSMLDDLKNAPRIALSNRLAE